MNNTFVSICIPTYNSAKYIKNSILSICQQSYKNIEIIIGDNASTDNTYDIVQELMISDSRISYYKNQNNLGYSGNCNKLISMARGEYVAIYHSDDIYETSIVEKEVEVLNNNREILGAFTLAKQIDSEGSMLPNMFSPFDMKNDIVHVNLNYYLNYVIDSGGSCFVCPTSMVRKTVYDSLGGYNTSLTHIDDQDMWARILKIGVIAVLPERLINYRIHPLQVSTYYLNIKKNELSKEIVNIEKFIKKNGLEKK